MSLRRLGLPALAVLTLAAGCAAPGLPSAPTGPAAAEPPVLAPGDQAPRYGLQAAEEPTSIVVRYRAGASRAGGGGKLKRRYRRVGADVVQAASVRERDALLARLRRDPAVEWAEPNYKAYASATAADVGPDPRLGSLWGLAKIQAPAAWASGTGAGVTVAVIDTGVDETHEDLAGRVDAGPDLVDNDGTPHDENEHGTHVAGTIAAIRDNALGVAGVAPDARILAVRVLGADGSGEWVAVAEGIVAATDAGAKVINLSLGGRASSSAVRDAVAYAVSQDVVVVCAAGNENSTRLSYPAAYPGVLSVGATTQNDARASFSNHGTWVNIAAPGSGILSTVPAALIPAGYDTFSGTSMAAPHVAGAAAVLRAARPDASASTVRQLLTATGDPVTRFSGNSAIRRLNLNTALAVATDVTAPVITPLAPTRVSRTGATLRWTTNERTTATVSHGTSASTLAAPRAAASNNGTTYSFALSRLTRNRTYHYRITARDLAGNATQSPVLTFTTAR